MTFARAEDGEEEGESEDETAEVWTTIVVGVDGE